MKRHKIRALWPVRDKDGNFPNGKSALEQSIVQVVEKVAPNWREAYERLDTGDWHVRLGDQALTIKAYQAQKIIQELRKAQFEQVNIPFVRVVGILHGIGSVMPEPTKEEIQEAMFRFAEEHYGMRYRTEDEDA